MGEQNTSFLLDGGNVVGESRDGVLVNRYVYGVNLVSWRSGATLRYYHQNAHGDVVKITTTAGTVTQSYDYDAFGNVKNPFPTDTNPFRYCGEYWDSETGTYYLRARYYDPGIGRFTQQDTHWSTANMIYGDNPQKINERQDALGLTTYTYVPQISAIMQSGNLYVYAVNNPVLYVDETGEIASATIHNWVEANIVITRPDLELRREVMIDYTLKHKYGRADLVSAKTGEVWEIKRASCSRRKAIVQLSKYVNGDLRTPIEGVEKLSIGGSKGSIIFPNIFIKTCENTAYAIAYWDSGDGIILYDYVTFRFLNEAQASAFAMSEEQILALLFFGVSIPAALLVLV